MKWFEKINSKIRLGICFILLAIFLFYIIMREVDIVALFLAVIAGIYLFYAIYVEEKLARRKEFEKKLEEERLKDELDRKKKELVESSNLNISISSAGSYSQSLEFPIYTKARGVTFDGRQELLDDSSVADDLIIVHRPTIKYPERMEIINESIGRVIGNIGAELAKSLVEEYGEGCKFYGMIEDITGGQDGQNLGCNLSIDGLEFD